MASFKEQLSSRNHRRDRPVEPEPLKELVDLENTGSEAASLRSLMEKRTKVTVVLTTGERVQGRIRYFDHACFSLRPAGVGPNIFLRKSAVRCIIEDQAPDRQRG